MSIVTKFTDPLLRLWIELEPCGTEPVNTQTVDTCVELFHQQLPIIREDDSIIKESLKSYEEISLIDCQLKASDSATQEHIERIRVTSSVVDRLRPHMESLAKTRPCLVEERMLQSPKIFYACFNLAQERLQYLQNKDFVFSFARSLENYSAENRLPSRLCELQDQLKVLDADELTQLGVLIDTPSDREKFARTFKIESLEEIHQVYLERLEESLQTVGFNGGTCFGCSISLIAQETPDPTMLNWERVKDIQRITREKFEANPSGTLPSMIPSEMLEEMHLLPPVPVISSEPINSFAETLKGQDEGRFVLTFEPMDHAMFLSLKERMYCDIGDYHIVKRETRLRRFATNEDMLAHLTRYLHVRYAGNVGRFSLARVDKDAVS